MKRSIFKQKRTQRLDIDELRTIDTMVPAVVHKSSDWDSISTVVLPSFHVGDLHYILLTDIQHVFNMREDQCLATIAHSLEADKDFVDPELDKYMLVDSHVHDFEFHSAATTLAMIYSDAMKYEQTLPSEEEFHEAQERLNIVDMGRKGDIQNPEESSIPKRNSTIDIWRGDLLVADENEQVCSQLKSCSF